MTQLTFPEAKELTKNLSTNTEGNYVYKDKVLKPNSQRDDEWKEALNDTIRVLHETRNKFIEILKR